MQDSMVSVREKAAVLLEEVAQVDWGHHPLMVLIVQGKLHQRWPG